VAPFSVEGCTALNIFIKTITGKRTQFDVEATDTIGVVKSKMQDRIGYPAAQLQLIYANHQLDDGRTLADYKIEPDSTLELWIRPH
jgi:ubiquitin C